MLLPVDFYEDFIDVKSVAVTSVLSLQSAGINGSELYAPEANCFSGYNNASLGEQIFNIAMTKVEAIIESDSTGNDIWRKSVAAMSIHLPLLPISGR